MIFYYVVEPFIKLLPNIRFNISIIDFSDLKPRLLSCPNQILYTKFIPTTCLLKTTCPEKPDDFGK